MALGAYGIKRPADVLPDDVQIIVHYTPSRDATSNFVVSQLPMPMHRVTPTVV